MMDAEQIKKQVQKENELRAAYARIFGGGDTNVRLILEDLERRGFYHEPVFDEKRPDPYLAIYRDGVRSTLLHIKSMAAARPINEEEFIKEMQNNEND